MHLLDDLGEIFASIFKDVFGDQYSYIDPILKPSTRDGFGDFQANFAMSLAKKLKKSPRDLAQLVSAELSSDKYINKVFNKVEVAGPGFINLWLSPSFLTNYLNNMFKVERLGIDRVNKSKNIVIDYGSPNVAKEMHVGHLRSTIIGDSLARVLSFLGHNVIRQNHLGDWGTQFGMLIQHLLDISEDDKNSSIKDLNKFYKRAKKKFDEDELFADKARKRVVLLQSGDKNTLLLWKQLVDQSALYFDEVYKKLGVLLEPKDIKSESSYNSDLAKIVSELEDNNIAEVNQRAKVVFLDGFIDKEGKKVPCIIQKADGGYLYATTDLAAAKYRIESLKADQIIYVIDARQAQHLAMLFAIVAKTNWSDVKMSHVSFGMVLGSDRKPFKTRSGETIPLISLIDESISRAKLLVKEKNQDVSESEINKISEVLGIGALKYGDLSGDRVKDYVFDWDRMLSFDGNSAPYLLNAYVRIKSIFRKLNIEDIIWPDNFILDTDKEKALALKILAFIDVINSVSVSLSPHHICTYLCELAASFHKFYESCSISKAESDLIKQSRIALSDLSARVIKLGLDLLGISVINVM